MEAPPISSSWQESSEPVAGGHGLEHAAGLVGDFGTDPVAG